MKHLVSPSGAGPVHAAMATEEGMHKSHMHTSMVWEVCDKIARRTVSGRPRPTGVSRSRPTAQGWKRVQIEARRISARTRLAASGAARWRCLAKGALEGVEAGRSEGSGVGSSRSPWPQANRVQYNKLVDTYAQGRPAAARRAIHGRRSHVRQT